MVELSVPRPAQPVRPTLPRALRQEEGADRRDLLWRTAWAPYWFWSDVPAPLFPQREPPPRGDLGLAGQVVLTGIDGVRRRLWLRHAPHLIVRGAWLGLAIGCLWLLVNLLGGPDPSWPALGWITGLLVALGALLALLAKPGRWEVARMLDRSFALQERLSTAVADLGRGVPKEGERASVVYLQMADAANAIDEIRRDGALGPRLPVREMVTALTVGLLLAGLSFLRGVGGDLPPLAAVAVPAFTPAADRPPPPTPVPAQASPVAVPSVDDVLQRSQRSNEAQRDLQALANALRDHAVTRSAADEIDRGNYPQAANALRDLAPNAGQMSPSAREELARDLETAGGQMSTGSDALKTASEQAAAGLRQGDQAAEQGVSDLGDAVEQTGGDVVSQRELADQMRQAQEAAASGRQSQGSQGGQANQGASGSQANQGQPGQPGAGQAGRAGEPGQGADAQGEGQPGQQGAPGESGSQGVGGNPQQAGAGQDGGQQGQAGQNGGAPADRGQAGQGQAAGQAGAQSQQGGGAGGGEGQPDQQAQAGAAGGAGPTQSQGVPAEQRISEGGDGPGGPGNPAKPVNETLALPPGSGNQSGVQTANDGGSAMQGSGTGATAGSGSAVQGEVGAAGPDSNRVPADYRSVVENYFSDGGQ